MRRGKVLRKGKWKESKWGGMKGGIEGRRGSGVSLFIKDIANHGISKKKEKRKVVHKNVGTEEKCLRFC